MRGNSKSRPRPLAVIREQECIGCTKCIQACPTDAILGSSKKMHTVIADECIGCKLCLPPCPVDCIDLIYPENIDIDSDPETRKQKAAYVKKRVTARQQRLEKIEKAGLELKPQDSQSYVQLALERIKARKI